MKQIAIVIIVWETLKWAIRKLFDNIINND